MSFDNSRLTELQGAMRTKMAENKEIADNFKIEEGTVVVSAEQKTAFDKNMSDIREIKSLVESLEAMRDADKWGCVFGFGLKSYELAIHFFEMNKR